MLHALRQTSTNRHIIVWSTRLGICCRLRQEVNNEYRLFRMVEILLSTGKPLSELNLDRTADLDYDFRCFFLNRNRLELYDRIGLRCEQMVAGGILRVCCVPLSTLSQYFCQ